VLHLVRCSNHSVPAVLSTLGSLQELEIDLQDSGPLGPLFHAGPFGSAVPKPDHSPDARCWPLQHLTALTRLDLGGSLAKLPSALSALRNLKVRPAVSWLGCSACPLRW